MGHQTLKTQVDYFFGGACRMAELAEVRMDKPRCLVQ